MVPGGADGRAKSLIHRPLHRLFAVLFLGPRKERTVNHRSSVLLVFLLIFYCFVVAVSCRVADGTRVASHSPPPPKTLHGVFLGP